MKLELVQPFAVFNTLDFVGPVVEQTATHQSGSSTHAAYSDFVSNISHVSD